MEGLLLSGVGGLRAGGAGGSVGWDDREARLGFEHVTLGLGALGRKKKSCCLDRCGGSPWLTRLLPVSLHESTCGRGAVPDPAGRYHGV